MIKINIDHLQPDMVVGKPILGSRGQVLLNTGLAIKPQHIFYLRQLGIGAVYVKDERLDDVVIDDVASEQIRSEGRALIHQLIEAVNAPGFNNKGINVVEQELIQLVAGIVEELISNKELAVQLMDIRSVDSYIFAHSVNCSILATLIAAKMDYNRNSLKNIALGSLLHDLGMTAIPSKILNKEGALTKDEYETVKKHPVYGYELFKKSSLFNIEAAEVVIQHHERNSGQGYPKGLKGNEISPNAGILAIADAFDALTSDKPNRKAYQNHEAIEMLMSWGGDCFNLKALRCFLSNIAAYPAGTRVLLSNHESGYVIANEPGAALRPLVRVLYDNNLSAISKPYDLDLKLELDITIIKVLEKSN